MAASLAACGGRGSVPPVTIPMQVPAPATHAMHPNRLRLRHPIYAFPTAHAAGVVVTPKAVTIYGKGKSSTVTVQVSESKYKGNFTQKNTCKGVATVALPKGSPAKVKLAGAGVGRCKVTFFDAKGNKGTLAVTDKKSGGNLVTAFFVPLRGAGEKRKHGRRPKFISPSTQSMTFDITPEDSSSPLVSVVSGLTAGSPNCVLALQGLECTFNSSLPSGTYNATITMYDAWDPTHDDIPAGAAPLSISYQSFVIANGATNDVAFDFQGIPAQVSVVANTPLVTHSGNVYDLIGPGAHSFYVEAFDADNNVIAGIGGPTNYSAVTSGALATTVGTPPPGSPRFSVTPPAILSDQSTLGTLTVCASYANTVCPAPSPSPGASPDGCSYPGALCSGAVTLDMQALLAVASSRSISLYAAEKGIGPVSTITSGVENTSSDIQFDSHGNLYSAEAGIAIHEYAIGSTIPTRTMATPAGDIFSKMALDSAGNLFALDVSASKVFVYPPGTTTASKTIDVGNAAGYPYNIAVDANDDFWIEYVQFDTDNAVMPGGNIGYFAHGSTVPVMLSGLIAPVGMALDTTNNRLYVSDQSSTYSFGHPYGCTDTSWCTLYAYTFGNWASPATVSAQAYAGDLQVIDEHITDGYGSLTIKAVFQDNADGQRFAIYRTDLGFPVPSVDAWDAGLQPATTQSLVVDQRGNMFAADVFASSVYGYRGFQFIGGGGTQTVTPFVTLTNGLRYPQPMAIVP